MDDFDFGFSTVDVDAIVIENNERVERIKEMIRPFLNNLMKDSEKSPYIHWPNRKEKILEFIEKIESI